MAHRGIFASDMSVAGDRRQPSGFDNALISLKTVGVAPFLTSIGENAHRGYRSTHVEWVEKYAMHGVNFIVQSGSADGLGASMRLADASWVTESMMFLVTATGEMLFVVGVAENIITVTRGFGGTPVSPLLPSAANGHILLQRVGTAFAEGSERPAAVAVSGGPPKYNYTQIFRNSWGVTRTASIVEYNMGNLEMRNKRDCFMLHVKDIETTLLLGIRASGVMNGQPLRTMDGLLRQIMTNIASPAGGILTAKALNYFLEVIFSQGIDGSPNNGRRYAICGIHFISLLTELARQSVQYVMTGNDNSYGLNITTWRTPFGELTFMPSEILSNMPGRRSDVIVIHPDAVHTYYLYEGEEMTSIQANNTMGIDAAMGGLITEMTMALKGEICCGIMTGICDVRGEPNQMVLTQPYNPPLHGPAC